LGDFFEFQAVSLVEYQIQAYNAVSLFVTMII